MTDVWLRFWLFVPGAPRGKERARTVERDGRRRTYTPRATLSAEDDIRRVWAAAGSPRMDSGGIAIDIIAWRARPAYHLNRARDGLSAAGSRSLWPLVKPDADNHAKLILDALNHHAWSDDVAICDLRYRKVWLPLPSDPDPYGNPPGDEGTEIRVSHLG